MTQAEQLVMQPLFLVACLVTFFIAIPLTQGRRFSRWRRSEAGQIGWHPARFITHRESGQHFTLFDLVGVLLLLFVFSLGLFTPPEEVVADSLDASLVVQNMVFQIALAAMVLGRLVLGGAIGDLGLKPQEPLKLLVVPPIVVLACWVFTSLLFLSGWQGWVQEAFGAEGQEVVRRISRSDDQTLIRLLVVSAVVVAPVAEELVFRGFIFGVLRDLSHPVFAMLASGLLFALVHGNLQSLPTLFLLGVILALVYHRSQSIWTPIACHALFNGLTVTVQLMGNAEY